MDDYTKTVKDFYEVYKELREKYELTMNSYASLFGRNQIKIYRDQELIVNCSEETSEDTYRKATNLLKGWKRREEKKNGRSNNNRPVATVEGRHQEQAS